ncbi:MAG: hypothetical protein JXB30_04805 [Anaerolineae bacterium]|nr:hypothetical protein [Anaerolineae bacterium]
MARRFVENTLHTGQVAYLHARGLLELDFPVLVRPTEQRYSYVVAQYPVEDEAGLYHRVWHPTESMQMVAAHAFRRWYTGYPQQIEDDNVIWEAARRVHKLASAAQPDALAQAKPYLRRIATYLSEQSGENVSTVTLAVVAEIYRWLGSLIFPHPMTASFSAATLLLMLGVPRERVAVFGMYYQDPTIYYQSDSDWHAGFLSGTPYYTVMGLFVAGRWIPIDFTLLADGPHWWLQERPHPHLRHAKLGRHPADGASLVVDYAHPYTMLFAPPGPISRAESPLLARIPLLRLFG